MAKQPGLEHRVTPGDSQSLDDVYCRHILEGRLPELMADTAYFFDDNTRVELRKVEATFYTTSGARDAYLTSRRGTYNSRTGTMTARGDVVVITEEGRRLTTPELKYDQQMNEIASDSAFVLTEPGRRLEGIGFRSDPNMQNVQILRTRSGSTGAVTLPGQ